jgi:hypothetical protein
VLRHDAVNNLQGHKPAWRMLSLRVTSSTRINDHCQYWRIPYVSVNKNASVTAYQVAAQSSWHLVALALQNATHTLPGNLIFSSVSTSRCRLPADSCCITHTTWRTTNDNSDIDVVTPLTCKRLLQMEAFWRWIIMVATSGRPVG